MSRDPADWQDYASYMMLDDEREAEEARAGGGYPPPLPAADFEVLRAAIARRAREDRERDARLYGEMEMP